LEGCEGQTGRTRTRGIEVVGEWDSSALGNLEAIGKELAVTLFNGGCIVAKKKAPAKKPAAKKPAAKKPAAKKPAAKKK